MKMKGFFSKLKDFSPKLKVSEILLFSKTAKSVKKKPVVASSVFDREPMLRHVVLKWNLWPEEDRIHNYLLFKR